MMFNVWLARRIEGGNFGRLLKGDLAIRPYGDLPSDETSAEAPAPLTGESRRQQKSKNWKKRKGGGGGMEDENPKVKVTPIQDPADPDMLAAFESGELTFSGPMFGSRGLRPSGAPLLLENVVSQLAGIHDNTYAQCEIFGNRRPARMPVNGDLDLSVEAADQGLLFKFTLPTGAYATTFLREFVKGSVGRPDADEGVPEVAPEEEQQEEGTAAEEKEEEEGPQQQQEPPKKLQKVEGEEE
jgi:tRNA(Glu) U13 pseudouridine synthase TruD